MSVRLETMSTKEKTYFPKSTSYWKELWDTYTTDFVSVEIHCWKEETKQNDEIKPLAALTQDQNLVMSYTITLNEENRIFLRNESIDINGGLKWFTLFFYQEATQMLEIGRYGSEIALYGITEQEGEEFKTLFPEGTEFEYFKEHFM
ncbi:MAG: hypothetical protein ACE3JQ_11450 [Paenisporosarcina sp.]